MPVAEPIVRPHVDEEKKIERPWKVILYNDDVHAFDQVVFQVQRATGCSLEEAEWITHEAHTRGRAIAFEGPRPECEKVAGVLRQIRLQVELDHA